MLHLIFKITLKIIFIITLIALHTATGYGQDYKLEMLTSSEPSNLRGLCPVTDSVVWVSGNYGRIGRSTDAGKNWEWMVPKGFEKSDFRDIEAFNENYAVVMASGYPAVILYTADGGKNWHEAFRSDDTLAFFDGMDFWDAQHGVCIGDWVNNDPYTLLTTDSGKSWKLAQHPTIGRMNAGTVASFAASGTCVRTFFGPNGEHCFMYTITGTNTGIMSARPGNKNNYVYEFVPVPYTTSAQSQGLFSLSYDTARNEAWVVGGDYSLPSFGFSGAQGMEKSGYFSYPRDEVKGYRSCVEFFEGTFNPMVIACGPNGADISLRDTKSMYWQNISTVPLNTAIKSKTGNTVYLCGPQGTVYRLGTRTYR